MAISPRPTSDEAAFEQLYRLHARSVYGFVHSRLGNPDDAEDVTQTTFLNAYRSCLRGRRPEHPESWLIAIARNECRQRFRQMQRRPQTALLEERTIVVPAPEAEWTADDIQRALNALPELSRRAIVMRELEGRSYAEIAAELGLSDSALQALLFRSRRQLREQFEATITCKEARHALAQRAKGELGIAGRRALRAHLRACPGCSAREGRPSRRETTVQLLLAVLPIRRVIRLLGLSGGGSAGTGAGAGGSAIAGKAAAVLVAGTIGGGVGYTIVEQPGSHPHPTRHPARVVTKHARLTRHTGTVTRGAPQAVRWVSDPRPRASAPARPPRRARIEKPKAGAAPEAVAPSRAVVPTPTDTPAPVPAPPSEDPGGSVQPTTPPADPQPDATPAAVEPEAPPQQQQQAVTDESSDVSGREHPAGRAKGRPDPVPVGPPERRFEGRQPGASPQPGSADAG